MADYASVDFVKSLFPGGWSNDPAQNAALQTLCTAISREFDQATDKPFNYYTPGQAVTRYYSGDGNVWLDIDDFDTITSVQMGSQQNRTDLITLTLTDTSSFNYVVRYPLNGPPFRRLYLLRGWLPDPYAIGNVIVQGVTSILPDVQKAVAIWVAYEWKRSRSGWQTSSGKPGNFGASVQTADGTLPPEVQRVITFYSENDQGGPRLAMIDGSPPVTSRWLGWRTADGLPH